jgi:hypothetical protein
MLVLLVKFLKNDSRYKKKKKSFLSIAIEFKPVGMGKGMAE